MAEWTSTLGPETLGDGSFPSQSDKTFRLVINSSLLSVSGRKVRLAFSRDHGSDVVIGECWIGHNSGVSGDYTFDGNQVQITFDAGNAGTTITSDGQKSDAVDFDLDASKHLVIAVYISTSSNVPRKSDGNHYFKWKSGNDASTEAATGYSSISSYLILVEEIEVVEGKLVSLSFNAGIQLDHPDRAFSHDAQVTFTLTGLREAYGSVSPSGQASVQLEAYREIPATLTLSAQLGIALEAFNWSEWLRDNLDRAVPRFYLTITGDADGVSDVEIPVESFQGRLRSGDPSYLECVVRDLDTNLSLINARSNGDMVLEMAWLLDGVESLREQITQVDIEDIRTDQGPMNESITVKGHRTSTPPAKVTALQSVTYRSLSNGKLHLRTAFPDLYLQPGDTVTYQDDEHSDSFTAGNITYIVNAQQQQMDVKEA